jgi:TPR repeat protein
MRTLFIFTFFFFCSTSFAESKYQSLITLNDQESAEIKIHSDHESRLLLKSPNNDFLPLDLSTQVFFDSCQESHTMLVFTQDINSLIKLCDAAYKAGAADAAFLIGESLLSAQWTAPDYNTAFDYLEKASDKGSRSAKRYLISAYQNPRLPINNSSRAYELAKELALQGMKWDIMIFSAMQSISKDKKEAIRGYHSILQLAKEGFQNAYNLSVLIKIVNGPLQNLEYAEELLDKPYKSEFYEIAFTKVMFSVMQNDLLAARDHLSECYLVSSACALTYVQFLSLGIAGDKDLDLAVNILDYILERSSTEFANDYAWARSTANEKPLFNPMAAQKAISHIPEYKKNLPYIKDTIAAHYAAKGDFSTAIEIQEEIIRSLAGKGLGQVYESMLNRLQRYKNNERWNANNDVKSYLLKLQNIHNLTHLDAEIAAL